MLSKKKMDKIEEFQFQSTFWLQIFLLQSAYSYFFVTKLSFCNIKNIANCKYILSKILPFQTEIKSSFFLQMPNPDTSVYASYKADFWCFLRILLEPKLWFFPTNFLLAFFFPIYLFFKNIFYVAYFFNLKHKNIGWELNIKLAIFFWGWK